ncbi:MAG: hypothetical protein JWL86_3827 [Rhizobium sp.]|nr:hypothetical protein [Rhizobium sp.]
MEDANSTRLRGWTNAILASLAIWTAIVAGIALL